MATISQKAYGTIISGLTTELNALVANTFSAVGPAVGGDAVAQDLFGDCELVVTFGTNPNAGTVCDLYFIPSADGTNYADGGGAVTPARALLVATFELKAQTTVQRLVYRDVPLPPGLFKCVVNNGAQIAMAATANTLKIRPHSLTSA